MAPVAAAKGVSYEGPVDQPPADPSHEPPRIEFKVSFKKNDKGKRVPSSIPKLSAWNIWHQCEHPVPGSGDPSTIFYPNAINDTKSEVITGVEFPVKRRRFSTTDSDGGTVIEVSGQLRGKQASGTVRITYQSVPGDDFAVGFCDSGPLSWTATR
jgi:hypothetical protein